MCEVIFVALNFTEVKLLNISLVCFSVWPLVDGPCALLLLPAARSNQNSYSTEDRLFKKIGCSHRLCYHGGRELSFAF